LTIGAGGADTISLSGGQKNNSVYAAAGLLFNACSSPRGNEGIGTMIGTAYGILFPARHRSS
jgi:hypothetical protein